MILISSSLSAVETTALDSQGKISDFLRPFYAALYLAVSAFGAMQKPFLCMFIISHQPVPRHIQKAAFMAESSGTADKEAVFGLLLFSGKALSFSIFEVYLTANFPQ
ncbi:MAG TPA: hypothetical protein H9744_04985 [Candidatus Eisenbergiella stercoravium]|nr:hypothetical protein [Candidatus Eisenbergiella stercoravium]